MKLFLSLLLSVTLAPAAFANKDDKKGIKSSSIEFSEGSDSLTDAQKQQIREMISALPEQGNNFNLGIAGWSDQPYPGEDGELSEDQRDLAKNRIEAVENFVTDELNFEGSVSTYDMSTQANWLARMFDTEGAEIRSVFAKGEKASDDTLRDRFKAYKKDGGPKKVALVLSPDGGAMDQVTGQDQSSEGQQDQQSDSETQSE